MKRPVKINSQKWPRHPDDWYVEESWIWPRFFEEEEFGGVIVDPACGSQRVIHAALQAGYTAAGCDIKKRPQFDRREVLPVHIANFMKPDWSTKNGFKKVHNICSNPPFSWCEGGKKFEREKLPLGMGFVGHCLQRSRNKVSLILPAKWGGGDQRSRWLENGTPLKSVRLIAPRPSMPPGPVVEQLLKAGKSPGGGYDDFAIFTWEHGYEGKPEYGWLRRERGAA